MTAPEFRAALVALGWSERHLADQLGCSPSLVHKWGRGTLAVPADVAGWVDRTATYMRDNPPPMGW